MLVLIKVFLYTNPIFINKVIKMVKVVNVEMDDALHKALKIKAIEKGKTMKEWIVEVLREAAGIEKVEEKGNG